MNSSSVRTAANFALWLIFSIVSSVSGCPPASAESEMSKKPGIELRVNCDMVSSQFSVSCQFLKNGYPQPTELRWRHMNSVFRRCEWVFSQTYLLGRVVK